MSRKPIRESVPSWDDIEKRVLAGFNLDDVGAGYAVRQWREGIARVRQAEDAGEVVHPFTSPPVIDALIAYFKADIAENEAIFRARLAKNDRFLKLASLRVALGESQGVFVDEDDEEVVVPELMAVVRVRKSAKTMMLQQVVESSLQLARATGEEAPEVTWPTGLGEEIEDFANDLKDFLMANGDQGREIVLHICEDRTYAKKVSTDEQMPDTLRFLAKIVVDANADTWLPDQERRIGFAGAS